MSEETKNEKYVNKKKHIVRNIIIIILIILILVFCGGYILHTQKLLPSTLDDTLKPLTEKIDKLFGINQNQGEEDDEETEKESEKIYKEIAELDKKYDDKDVEIIDVINPNTSMFEVYSEKTRENISIIRVDDKYGLIDNQKAKVVIEPEYEYIYDDMGNMNGEEYLYGLKDNEKYVFNLKTFDEYPNESTYGHGGGSLTYYEPNKKELYTNVYNYEVYTPMDSESKRIQNYGGNVLDICYELSEDGKELEEAFEGGQSYYIENNLKVGYYNVKTGKLDIKTEYDKGSLFDNGIAAVQKSGKSYFINEKNEKIYNVEFEDATNIHNNKAWVKIEGKWKYVEFPEIEEKEDNEDNEDNEEDTWKEIYSQYIIDGNLEIFEEFLNPDKEPSISFVDLNSDGTPELLFYDGMTPGLRGNLIYSVYSIENGKVKQEEYGVWAGPFKNMGYNPEKDTYAFTTEIAGTSAYEAGVTVANKNGIEDKIYNIENEEAYSLEDDGYKTKEITIKETKLPIVDSKKEREKAVKEAIKNYLPNKELYNK